MKLNRYSRKITQDESLPAAQAMLYAIGMDENDQRKPRLASQVQVFREIPAICT
jgi:hypothetical protein